MLITMALRDIATTAAGQSRKSRCTAVVRVRAAACTEEDRR